jgi:alanine racemase
MNEMRPLHADTTFDQASARLSVDLSAIVANWRTLCRLSGKARTSAVVKADAYGLGAAQVGAALSAAGCRDFFVATPEEGARLRASVPEARIFVLNGVWAGVEAPIFTHRLIPVIGSLEHLAFFHSRGRRHPYALYVDTGMNRLGLTIDEAAALASATDEKPELIVSHLACPDTSDHPLNGRQRYAFQAVARMFEGVESSLSSSAGILLGSEYHFDLTRPGIALYGGDFVAGTASRMLPVATAEARILQIRNVRQGEIASYGATHVFDRDSRIAVVGAGYADGWHRNLSGSGVSTRKDGSAGAFGFISGARVPIVGRITMDLTTFDIGALPENAIRTGDYIELFGANIRLDETARAAGTIGYELLTSLRDRYVRRYV